MNDNPEKGTNPAEEQPKQESKVGGFFKKLGKKLDDATYAMRLQSDFDKSHTKYVVYSGTAALSITPEIAVEEHLEENFLLTLDDDEQIAAGNLIKKADGDEVLHIAAVEKATLTVTFEDKLNELPASKIILGDVAEQVNVIRVEDKFYKV